MRSLPLLAGVTALLIVDAMPAQIQCGSGVSVPIPAFSRTFSSSFTRGLYFQAPISFTIDEVSVPDESGAGVQNVEIYTSPTRPPAYSSTITPTLLWSAYNQPVGNLSTGGITINAGDWLMILGACGTSTMHNSYGPNGGFPSNIAGLPITMYRCLTQNNIYTTQGPNPISSEDAYNVGRIEFCVTPLGSVPPILEATAEAQLNTNTLDGNGGYFSAQDYIRWNYNDVTGGNTGAVGATVFNIGVGGSAPIGSTPQIPGFDQLWAGSTPSGTAHVLGPTFVGAPDAVLPPLPSLFNTGDTLRMQALMLDASAGGPGLFPVTPMINTIEFTFTDCFVRAGFDGLASGTGSYPTNWSNGGGTYEWEVDSGGTTSSSTGPSSAVSPSNYMYCETSSPALAGDTYIMNTGSYASSNLSNATLSFQLSRIGATIGTLEVRMDDGSGTFATVLATYTGPEPNGVEWTQEVITLPTPLPTNVQFQFHYTRGSSFTGDIALDDVCIE